MNGDRKLSCVLIIKKIKKWFHILIETKKNCTGTMDVNITGCPTGRSLSLIHI